MSTYEHNLLAARFAALAPEPLPGDWADVVGRVARSQGPSAARAPWHVQATSAPARRGARGCRRSSRWSAPLRSAVRVFFLDKGFIGLPPVGATPSAPESGELVLHWWERARPTRDPTGEEDSCRPMPHLDLRRRANDLVAGRAGSRGRERAHVRLPGTTTHAGGRRAPAVGGRRTPRSQSQLPSRLSPTTIRGRARSAALALSFRRDYAGGGQWKYATATGSSASTG